MIKNGIIFSHSRRSNNTEKPSIVKKTFLPLIAGCISISFAFAPIFKSSKASAATASASVNSVVTSSANEAKVVNEESSAVAAATLLYDSLDLESLGLSREAAIYAYKGFQKLSNNGSLRNENILTVVDFSQPSDKKRMYIIDVKNFKVLVNTYVAHGKNTGLQKATNFSNTPESLQSSLGFYVTKNTYIGKHGLSLRLEGLEKGFNDKAMERAIVVHGANYIGSHRLGSPYMGRSFGCPAVPQELSAKVINYIKDGTCLFIYHPSKSYLHGSKILNG